MNKELITQAFEKLGPERVQRGLAAFDDYRHTRRDSTRCFLARAGETDTPRVERSIFAAEFSAAWAAVDIIGYEGDGWCEIIDAFEGEPRAFKALAEKWLEQNRVVTETCAAVSATS